MTFSIVARDIKTGALGVAVATAGPMVGALVPQIRPGFGAAATQAMTNPYLALDALAVLDNQAADKALQSALNRDAEANIRQIILIDRHGGVDGWTGGDCIGFAGHKLGEGVAVAGNMLTGEPVLEAMMGQFRQETGSSGFARTLFGALAAGAAAGGDKRGLGSAALRIHGSQAFPDIDLRVDQADAPIAALETLLDLALSGSYHDFFNTVPRR